MLTKSAKRFITAVLACFLLFVTMTPTFGYFYNSYNLPAIKTHADIPMQPMRTFEQSLATATAEDLSKYPNSDCTKLSTNWVANENTKEGISFKVEDWKTLNLSSAKGSALWLNKTSGSCGDTIDIHASLYATMAKTFKPGPRSIEALRIGWYQGSGARQVWDSGKINLTAEKSGYPRGAVRMVETNWPTTLRVKIDQRWVPGFYLFITRDLDGTIENAAPFVLHSPLGSSKLMVMHSFITWNAYNSFGGWSAYFGSGATKTERRDDRSRVVSLDRPIIGSGGFSLHRDAISLVQFLEQQGINYDQYSDFDLDSWPSIIRSYNGIVLGGHPEYFTRRIFDTLIAARNSKINVAVLGGNTGIWQVRMTESKVGASRRIIIYRKATEDPIVDLRQISIKFADERLNIPSTLLTGTLAGGVHVFGSLKAINIPSWLQIPTGASINGISPDSEVDHVVVTSASPPDVHVLFSGVMNYSTGPVAGAAPRPEPIAETVWFSTPSGAAIFNAGITTWSCDLIQTCAYSTVDKRSREIMASLTRQILELWQIKGIGKTLNK
jgi:hypothetical protein